MTDAQQPDRAAELTHGAADIVARARAEMTSYGDPVLGVNHWLLAVVVRNGKMAERLTTGLSSATLRPWLQERLRGDEPGSPLDESTVVSEAGSLARARGKAAATEAEIVEIVLRAAGYEITGESGRRTAGAIGHARDDKLGEQAGRDADVAAPEDGGQAPAAYDHDGERVEPEEPAWQPRATRPTPTLDSFGRDLTAAAAAGSLPTLVGRVAELDLVVETLCRRTKRNPVLVGPAGTGKTAIVEGLAARIVAGGVPPLLRGMRIVQLEPSSLVSGAGVYGALDERMRAVLAEASQEGIALFIDEVHSIVGAGGARGSSDIASLLKPALARGEIACIAATTDDEYRRFIEEDSALERRFAPVLVREPTLDETVAIVRSHRDALAELRGVTVGDGLLRDLVRFAADAMPDRRFPDKAVELLEQVVAHAVATGSIVATAADVDLVGRRLTGLPTGVAARLEALAAALGGVGLLPEADAARLVDRLAVGLRGVDVRRERPNAVVLMADEQSRAADALAEMIAETLFGSPDRVVVVEAGRMTEQYDVSMLVGAPPGYIGYSDDLPIHAIARMPACVVLVRDADLAHPRLQDLLGRAIASGALEDGAGRPIHLGDTVVILTAAGASVPRRRIGFATDGDTGRVGASGTAEARDGPADREVTATTDPTALLGAVLGEEVDLVFDQAPAATTGTAWLAATFLPEVARRMADRGIGLAWSDGALGWLVANGPGGTRGRAWERFVDEVLGRAIAARVEAAEAAGTTPIRLRVVVDGDVLRVDDDDSAPQAAVVAVAAVAAGGIAETPAVDPAGPDGRS